MAEYRVRITNRRAILQYGFDPSTLRFAGVKLLWLQASGPLSTSAAIAVATPYTETPSTVSR
jgi:hypothetical protein